MTMSATGDSFWENEVAWQRETVAKPFDLDIPDHRQEGSRFKPFVTYNVTSSLAPGGVRRRYSDFEWLREMLRMRFHGIAIPVLPEKRVLNQGEQFLEDRKRGLLSFLRGLMANPYLRLDHTVKAFLTVVNSAAGEWDQAKKAATAGEGAHPSVNEGLNRWFGVLRHLALPADADDAAAALTVHLNEMEKALGGVLGSVTAYHDAAAKMAAALKSLHVSVESLESTAMLGSTSLPATLPDATTAIGAFGTVSAQFGAAVGSLHDTFGFAPGEIQVFLMDLLLKEIGRINAVKDLLKTREQCQKDYKTAWGKQDKLEFEQKQFTAKGRQDKADQLEPRVAENAQIVKQCGERLEDVTKGLLHVEARRVSQVRLEKFTRIIGQYAALGIASGAKTKELWSNLLGSLELDETTMVTAAQATLATSSADDATDVSCFVTPVEGATVDVPAATTFAGAAAGAGAGEATVTASADPFDDDEIEL